MDLALFIKGNKTLIKLLLQVLFTYKSNNVIIQLTTHVIKKSGMN